MARTLDATVIAALQAGTVRPVLLVQANFPSGTLLLWSGFGDLVWNNNTWIGAGHLLAVSPIEETDQVRAAGISISLNSMSSAVVALALSDARQGLPADVWIALLDDTGAVIGTPYTAFQGLLDVPTIEDGGETAVVSIAYESRLADLQRARVRRYTDEDQRAEFSWDWGFSHVAGMQDKQIAWGVKQ